MIGKVLKIHILAVYLVSLISTRGFGSTSISVVFPNPLTIVINAPFSLNISHELKEDLNLFIDYSQMAYWVKVFERSSVGMRYFLTKSFFIDGGICNVNNSSQADLSRENHHNSISLIFGSGLRWRNNNTAFGLELFSLAYSIYDIGETDSQKSIMEKYTGSRVSLFYSFFI